MFRGQLCILICVSVGVTGLGDARTLVVVETMTVVDEIV